MKKGLVILMAVAMLFAFAGVALADDIKPNEYTLTDKDWNDYVQANAVTAYPGYDPENDGVQSTHKYGTWNSPYTKGVDGYNYNDSQEAVANGDMDTTTKLFTSGPHGGYLTSTHRCRECHAVHRAAGKFKLLRSNERYLACDWCHGNGAGSGFNIQMDNNDDYTTEYNVGHTMGFGIDTGKWKAPDDTYPAFTPNYWLGGFSCFDCHSPHANPSRLLGYNDGAQPVGMAGGVGDIDQTGKVYGIANPGHANLSNTDKTQWYNVGHAKPEPIYLSGSWLLIKNPDREIATNSDGSVQSGIWLNSTTQESRTADITAGQEIPDWISAELNQFSLDKGYPVNKVPTDWDSPVGPAGSAVDGSEHVGFNIRSYGKRIWNVSEFCTDCHDGNAGLHTVAAPLFSEDRALRNQTVSGDSAGITVNGDTTNYKGSYDVAYGHDAQPRH